MSSLKKPLYCYRKVTLKISIPLLQKDSDIRDGRVVPTILLKLQKKWVIYIGENVYLWKKH